MIETAFRYRMKLACTLRSTSVRNHGADLCLFAVVCLSLTLLGGCGVVAQNENVEFPQDDLKQLQLEDLDGQPFDAWSEPEPRTKVFLFAGIDCPISNRYAPKVSRLYKRFHPKGIDFVLVYSHADETPDRIRRHLVEFSYPCVAVRDPNKTLAKLTGAIVTPEAAVIDSDLRMVYRGRIDNLFADFGTTRAVATTNELNDVLEDLVEGKELNTETTEAIGCPIEGVVPRSRPGS